ncbi:MAG: hypothetical protein P8Y54_01240 [Xanthomonadales bacterium]
MRSLAEIGQRLDTLAGGPPRPGNAAEYLDLGEEILEHWVLAKGKEPTRDEREGFRLLALHRQGADRDPSFNACRETCRELAYHYNVLTLEPEHPDTERRARMMGLVANHLYLFIAGKMENEKLGDFCCASRPVREKVDGV